MIGYSGRTTPFETALSGGGRSFLREAFAAENRAVLCGTKGYGRIFAALRAGCARLYPRKMMRVSDDLRRGENGYAVGLTRFAAFGFVLEVFVVKEELFPGGEHEFRATIDATEYLVLKFH